MRISDWSSDVCSSDLHGPLTEYSQYGEGVPFGDAVPRAGNDSGGGQPGWILKCKGWETDPNAYIYFITQAPVWEQICDVIGKPERSEEHTSELQSLMRISYAVFCLKKKKNNTSKDRYS